MTTAVPGVVELVIQVAGFSQRLFGRIEHHELQRVRVRDLPGGNAMLPPVVLKVGDEAAERTRSISTCGRAARKQSRIPTFDWHREFRIATAAEQIVERRQRSCAGKTAPRPMMAMAGASATTDTSGEVSSTSSGTNTCPGRVRRLPVRHRQTGGHSSRRCRTHPLPHVAVRLPAAGPSRPADVGTKNGCCVPGNLRVRGLESRRRGDDCMLHRQQRLDQTGEAGRLPRVADVRFDARDWNRL